MFIKNRRSAGLSLDLEAFEVPLNSTTFKIAYLLNQLAPVLAKTGYEWPPISTWQDNSRSEWQMLMM